MEEYGPFGVFRVAFTISAPGARCKPALRPPSRPWTVANVGPMESARAGWVRARCTDERHGGTEKCASTTDSRVVAAGDRADPPQLCRPTRMPMVLGGRRSPEARATRAPAAALQTQRGASALRTLRALPRVRAKMLWLCGPRWDFAALGLGLLIYRAGRSTRQPQDSTLGGHHCHHRPQEQGAVQGPRLWPPPTRAAGAA